MKYQKVDVLRLSDFTRITFATRTPKGGGIVQGAINSATPTHDIAQTQALIAGWFNTTPEKLQVTFAQPLIGVEDEYTIVPVIAPTTLCEDAKALLGTGFVPFAIEDSVDGLIVTGFRCQAEINEIVTVDLRHTLIQAAVGIHCDTLNSAFADNTFKIALASRVTVGTFVGAHRLTLKKERV